MEAIALSLTIGVTSDTNIVDVYKLFFYRNCKYNATLTHSDTKKALPVAFQL